MVLGITWVSCVAHLNDQVGALSNFFRFFILYLFLSTILLILCMNLIHFIHLDL